VFGQWNNILQKSQIKRIVVAHGQVMKKLGYKASY